MWTELQKVTTNKLLYRPLAYREKLAYLGDTTACLGAPAYTSFLAAHCTQELEGAFLDDLSFSREEEEMMEVVAVPPGPSGDNPSNTSDKFDLT